MVSRDLDLQKWMSRLTEANARVNEPLVFDEVLQDIIDSAVALTGARYGVISVMDDDGDLDVLVTSGTNDTEHRKFVELPDGMRIFDFFREIPGPVRVDDYSRYATTFGLNGDLPVPVYAGMAMPLRLGGRNLGTIYVGRDKDGSAFTHAEEQSLVVFAAQAVVTLVNAQRLRDERRARADLETLINASPVGVAVFDTRKGVPIFLNREAARIMEVLQMPERFTEDFFSGMKIRRADGREIILGAVPASQILGAGETVRAEEMTLQIADGPSVTALINVSHIRSEDGEIRVVVFTLQDMTEMEGHERMRAEFLATVSHELRTPLATVRGSVSALLDQLSSMHPAEIHQFHRIILEQTDRMRTLITDLLDVARIETGSLSISQEPTDMPALIADAVSSFRLMGHGHEIRLDIPPDLPWTMADKSRIAQVISNLLANAARFSPDSSIISIRAETDDWLVSVSVSDEGRGIPAENLPHLFRKFSQVGNEESGSNAGLGLAVCRGIVEAHGGRIWAESEGRGLGARFTFTLPTAYKEGFALPSASLPPSVRSAGQPAKKRTRILAVDDDFQALKEIRDTLVNSGYEVVATVDPYEAAWLMEEHRPSVVLLDMMLPRIDGVELMKDLKRAADVPVIFVSAYGQDRLIERAFQMGADDYVVKPFSPVELQARIDAALRRKEAIAPAASYSYGALTINCAERVVTLGGDPVALTPNEYQLLAELSANAGQVLTYKQLLTRIWDSDGSDDLRPLRTAVSGVRRKLGDDADDPTYIFTEFRVGYKMPSPLP